MEWGKEVIFTVYKFCFLFLFLFIPSVSAAVIIGEDQEDIEGVIIGETGIPVENFLELDDTPSSYAGEGGDCVIVNAGETGLRFGNCSNVSGGGSGDITSVLGDQYITNGSVTGDVNLVFNDALLNTTIDARSLSPTEANLTYLNLSGTNANQNLNIGIFNITASFFLGLFNWVIGDGPEYISFNGSTLDLNVTRLDEDFNQTPLINTVNTTANIEVLGFVTGAHAAGGNDGLFVNYTNTTTTGNITFGALAGYSAGNAFCNSEVATGSHMCTAGEILNSINNNISADNFTATFRVSELAPGFLAEANDCNGWTSPTGTALGSIFVGDPSFVNGYGTGSLVACNAERAIGCCL